MSTTLDQAAVTDLAGRVSGSVLAPDHADYDATRAVHNGLIDRKPALIVRCRKTDDVVAALAFARAAGLEVSIRGGGHNVAGRAVTDGGVMIDLAEMKAITVDPDQANRHGRARRGLGRAERCCRRARAGRDRRRDLDDRHRGLHARRRPRLADGQARARRRQPARGRARHGRRRGARGRRRLAPRSLLGAPRRRRELRRSRRRSRTACTR